MTETQILSTKKKFEKYLLSKSGVLSVSVGYKIKNGQKTEDLCLTIKVKKKIPLPDLHRKDVIPEMIDGILTDVVEE